MPAHPGGGLVGEARLADTTQPCERDQPNPVLLQEFADISEFLSTTDEWPDVGLGGHLNTHLRDRDEIAASISG